MYHTEYLSKLVVSVSFAILSGGGGLTYKQKLELTSAKHISDHKILISVQVFFLQIRLAEAELVRPGMFIYVVKPGRYECLRIACWAQKVLNFI